MAGAWNAAFCRLCTLERRIEVDELLQSFELPLQANEKEMDGEREWRLAHAQLKNLMVSVWADGTPMCNRSFQAHTFSFMCASPARHRATCLGSGGRCTQREPPAPAPDTTLGSSRRRTRPRKLPDGRNSGS